MSIASYLQGIEKKIASRPFTPESSEILRLTLRIEALYRTLDEQATLGDRLSNTHEGQVPLNPGDES